MREIQLLCLAFIVAGLLCMLGPAMTTSFIEREQKQADEAFAAEVEKAKKTIEANKGKE